MQASTERLKQQLRGIEMQLPRTFPRTGRNLILGLAMHYSPEQVMPFVESIRGCGYNDDIVMLVSNLPQSTIDYLHHRDVRTVRFETHRMMAQHIVLSRWVRFFEFLMDCVDQRVFYDAILISDTRDVVLQGTAMFGEIGRASCRERV